MIAYNDVPMEFTGMTSAAKEAILEMTRTASTDYSLTRPNFSWMSKDMLMWIRGILFLTVTIISGSSLWKQGITAFPWFISDWGVASVIVVEGLLFWSHFRSYDVYFDTLVKSLFEMISPFQVMVFLMFWLLYYTNGLWNPSDLETYTYTVNMHLVPIAVLAIEGLLNSIVFDI